jgi:hypothetical protein
VKILAIILLISAISLVGCASLDVVGKDAARAFGETAGYMDTFEDSGKWTLTADGETSLTLGANYAAINVDAQPFYDAGLSLDYRFDISRSINEASGSDGSPADIFKHIVENDRSMIGYHAALDHYNIDLGGGNMFEWAKDMSTNDKDIVFVLNPEPLIAAGVDPESVEGWAYAQVPIEENGKTTQVWKLLKPFDLK